MTIVPFDESVIATLSALVGDNLHTSNLEEAITISTAIDENPLLHLTARRFPAYKQLELQRRARDRLAERFKTHHTWRLERQITWTRERRYVGWYLNAYRLLGDYVKAHLREPDRIDILGDLSLTVDAINLRYSDGLRAKVPAIAAFEEAYLTRESRGWRGAHWSAGSMLLRSSSEHAYHGTLPLQSGHMIHASIEEPTKVAYVKSVRDLMRWYEADDRSSVNWVTRTTPGRYLKKFYPHLSEDEVRAFANRHVTMNRPVEVKIARTESECVRVVGEGPSESCMCNRFHSGHTDDTPWYRGHVHPAAIYGSSEDDPTWATDTEILYFEVDDEIKARVICNAVTKKCARIYGDAEKLLPAIQRMGYSQEVNALVGARVRRIENEDGDGYIMAYVDAGLGSGGGYLYAESDGRHWVLGTDGISTYVGYESRGVTFGGDDEDEFQCTCCGDYYNADEATTTVDGPVCESCLNDEYVEARGQYGYEFVRTDDAVYCHSNCDHYVADDAAHFDVYMCEVSNEYYKLDDLYSTSIGLVHGNYVKELDVPDQEGNDWACQDDTALTHDGRTVHVDEAVADVFEHRVYHEDDEGVYYLGGWFDEASFRENIDAFYVIGGTLMLVPPGSLARVQRGAIPLTEYLKAFGADFTQPDLNTDFIDLLRDVAHDLQHSDEEEHIDYRQAA